MNLPSIKTRFKFYLRSELAHHKFANVQSRLMNKSKPNASKVHMIYRESRTAGLFSFLYTFLPEFEWAEINGLSPVVDLCNYSSIFRDIHIATGLDPWTIFFDPTNSISLEEAYSSSNLSNSNCCLNSAKHSVPFLTEWTSKFEYINLKRTIYQTYMKPSNYILDSLNKAYTQYFDPSYRTLGVNLRGLCYNLPSRNSCHPIQPTLEQAITQTDYLIDLHSISKVYLVCPDIEIINAYKIRYGKNLDIYNRPAYSLSSASKNYFEEISSNEAWVDNLSSYLVSVLLLKNCDVVCASLTSSSILLPLILNTGTPLIYFNYGIN